MDLEKPQLSYRLVGLLGHRLESAEAQSADDLLRFPPGVVIAVAKTIRRGAGDRKLAAELAEVEKTFVHRDFGRRRARAGGSP